MMTSVQFHFGSPLSSEVVVCGHFLATWSLTISETLKIALVAVDLNAGVIVLVTA